MLLNLVMFGFSLIAALGTAFLAGPTLSGETESGIALAVLARPVRRSAVLLGKWLGLVVFGSGFVVARRAGPVPRRPGDGGLLAAAAGGRPRAARGADHRAAHPRPAAVDGDLADGVGRGRGRPVRRHLGRRRGRRHRRRRSATTASRASAPSRGCSCPPTACGAGRCTRFQDPSALVAVRRPTFDGFPFLSAAPLTAAYLAWAAVWVAMVWGLAAASFVRKDL